MRKEEENQLGKASQVEGLLMFALANFPEVSVGDDISSLIVDKVGEQGGFVDNDIVFIASKIISKAEDLIVDLREVAVSDEAVQLSAQSGKPAVVCQVILDNCKNVHIGSNGKIVLAENSQGIISTSGGVDKLDEHHVALLPGDPDKKAHEIREGIEGRSGKKVAVVLVDSDGLPQWKGAIAIPIGSSGIEPLRSTETYDPILKRAKTQEENILFMLANSAAFLLGQRGKGTPVIILRGASFDLTDSHGTADAIHQNNEGRM